MDKQIITAQREYFLTGETLPLAHRKAALQGEQAAALGFHLLQCQQFGACFEIGDVFTSLRGIAHGDEMQTGGEGIETRFAN